MSGALVARDGAGWREVDPPADAAAPAHALRVLHDAEIYAAQKDALDAWHEAEGVDVYVSECSVISKDDVVQSYCVWAQGVKALLPVTDWVAVVPEGEKSDYLRMPWAALREISGARMQAAAEHPARFLVDSFPDAGEWAALREKAMP
jgi:hypothetical protein